METRPRLQLGLERWRRAAFAGSLAMVASAGQGEVLCPIRTSKHQHSGVTVHHFPAKGPLFSALVVVPTTAPANGSGIPHALEHLNFLGSELYPERGYLDTLATRGLSSGSNAWTADDYTAYSITNAGLHGLLTTLPVLLDHIFFPTLTKVNFVHEIFHMGKEGPSGVLWNEMIGRENSESDLLNQAWRGALFKGTPLENDAGGRTPAIAELSNEAIASYHNKFYRQSANKVVVVLGGGPDDGTVLDQALEVVNPVLSRLPSPSPPQPPAFALQELKNAAVTRKFPCAEEDVGTVSIAWRGPKADDLETITALSVLMRYLAGTQSSPLFQRFVENSAPVASDIERDIEIFPVASIVLSFVGVEIKHQGHEGDDEGSTTSDDDSDTNDKQEDGDRDDSSEEGGGEVQGERASGLLEAGHIRGLVEAFFAELVKDGDGSSLPGGLEDLHGAVEKERVRFLESLEGDPHDHIQTLLIPDIMYSAEFDVGTRLNSFLRILESLLLWPLSRWRDLLQTWLIDGPHVDVVMIPSQSFADEVQEDARNVIENCKAKLGPEGIERSIAEADKATENIKRSRQAARERPLPSIPTSDIPKLPFKQRVLKGPRNTNLLAQLVEIDSQFGFGNLCFETCHIDPAERSLLPLLTDLLLASPLQLEGGEVVSYTDVVQKLSSLTVSAAASIGVGSGTRELLSIDFTCRAEKFDECCDLISKCITFGVIEPDRVKNVASAALNFALEDSRDGDTVTQAANVFVNERLRREKDSSPSNAVLLSVIHQRKVLREVEKLVHSKEGLESLVGRLETLKQSIFFGAQGLIQVAGRDPDSLHHQFSTKWALPARGDDESARPLLLSKPSFKLEKIESGRCTFGNGTIISIAGTESTYAEIWVDSEVTREHEDFFTLAVLCELVSLTEGPIYSRIRGKGLAYDANLSNRLWCNELCFSMYESSDPAAGWNEFCLLLDDLEAELDSGKADGPMLGEIETARSAVLYGMFESKASPAGIVGSVFRSCRSGVDCDMDSDVRQERVIERVSVEDLRRVFDRYLRRFGEDGRQAVALACGSEPGLAQKIADSFRTCNRPLELSIFDSLDSPSLQV